VDHRVVRAIQALVLIVAGQHGDSAVWLLAGDLACGVLAGDEPLLPVQCKAIRIAGGVSVGGDLKALWQFSPAHSAAAGNIAEQQVAVPPHRTFREAEATGDPL